MNLLTAVLSKLVKQFTYATYWRAMQTADPTNKRNRSISEHPEKRHPFGIQNRLYGRKLSKIENYITYATNHPDVGAHAGSPIIMGGGDIKRQEQAKYDM
jgi:hypothetical protein